MSTDTSTPSRAERRRAETRREIVDAAFDCFAERGYHHTGIADIAARLGMGHGTFYRHFANKRDIVEHVIDDVVARIGAALAADAPQEAATLDDYRAQTARIGEALARLVGDDPRIPRLLLFDAPGVDADLRERILDLLEQATDLTAAYLVHGVEIGYLRADLDVAATARAINGMILGGVVRAARHPDADDQAAMARALQSVMYDGIAAKTTGT